MHRGLAGPLASGAVTTLEALPLQPWRNGGGQTRELASLPDPDGGVPFWRVSAAELQASGPFSHFVGLDRQAMLIALGDAKPLLLQVAGAVHTLHALGDQLAFEGEAEISLHLPGAAARFWNVMTRRGAATASLRCWRGAEWASASALQAPPAGSVQAVPTQILLVLAGTLAVQDPDGQTIRLRAGELRLWPEAERLRCQAASVDAVVVQTVLVCTGGWRPA